MITIDKWKDMIYACEGVSNVTLVCSDSTISSHKIIIASISDWIKDLLMPIPIADSVTIMLPDLESSLVLAFINQHIFQGTDTGDHHDFEDLKKAFQVQDFVFSASVVKKDEDPLMQSEPNIKLEFSEEIPEQKMVDDTDMFENFDNFYDEGEGPSDEKIPRKKSPKKGKVKKETKIPKMMNVLIQNPNLLDDIDDGFDERVTESPDTKAAKKKNDIIAVRNRYKAAIESMMSGECKGYHKAAKKFGVSKSSLYRYVTQGRLYQGSGSKSKIFTQQEEAMISERALSRSDGGNTLTYKIVEDCLHEELNILRVNQPDRGLPEVLTKRYLGCFCVRNDLKKHIVKFAESKRHRIFECEICYQKFTFKNCLVGHQRSVHPAFFQR